MKKSKPITIEFDFNNPKVKRWFKEKSKFKKLEDITFEEILNECPEAVQFKTVQVLSTEGQKWHISQLEDKSEITKILKQHGIFKLLDRYGIQNRIDTGKILDILNKGFYEQTALLDVLKDAQGGRLNLVDGHFTQLCSQMQEQLRDVQKDDKSKLHQRTINKLSNQIEKAKTSAKMPRKDTLSASNPFTSSIQMVGYQALNLYEYLREVIPQKLEIVSDRKLYAAIAGFLNLRYHVKKYNRTVIKYHIENAIEHREKIRT